MLDAKYLSDKFTHALMYGPYVQSGTGEQQRRWREALDAVALSPVQRQLVAGFAREMKVLIISGVWCGDCIVQCPMMQRIAEVNPFRVQLRFVDRDGHKDLADQVKINAGLRVPVVLFMAEDFQLCGAFGERTL